MKLVLPNFKLLHHTLAQTLANTHLYALRSMHRHHSTRRGLGVSAQPFQNTCKTVQRARIRFNNLYRFAPQCCCRLNCSISPPVRLTHWFSYTFCAHILNQYSATDISAQSIEMPTEHTQQRQEEGAHFANFFCVCIFVRTCVAVTHAQSRTVI